MGAPTHANFTWAGCPHATPDGNDTTSGNPHFPCKECQWESNAATKPTKKK